MPRRPFSRVIAAGLVIADLRRRDDAALVADAERHRGDRAGDSRQSPSALEAAAVRPRPTDEDETNSDAKHERIRDLSGTGFLKREIACGSPRRRIACGRRRDICRHAPKVRHGCRIRSRGRPRSYRCDPRRRSFADDARRRSSFCLCAIPASAIWIACSDSGSSAAVGSSRSRIGAFLSMARAIAIRCLWPAESCRPCSPTEVP